MRRLLAIPVAACLLLLTACASTPAGAGAVVVLDRCGQPVVTTHVEGVAAGSGYLADTRVRVYKPCPLDPSETPDATPPR